MKVSIYVREKNRNYIRAERRNVYPTGTVFCLRYLRGSKRVWETLDVLNYAQASIEGKKREIDLIVGSATVVQPVANSPVIRTSGVRSPSGVTLDGAIDIYLSNVAVTKSHKTISSYTHTLGQFFKSCGNRVVQDIAQQDLINFVAYLRNDGCGNRTIHNRLVEVTTLLRASGVKDVSLKHSYTEKKVSAYRPDELQRLFAACTDEEYMLFSFFLNSGFREQEVAHACYTDVNFEEKTITVREKHQFNFKPKDYEERIVPMSDAQIEALKMRKDAHPNDWLIFPTADGKTNGHMLRSLKERALSAGLNCGRCINKNGESCKEYAVCDHWILHRFRKSFATIHERSGVSARSIQGWLGHQDLTTTLCYLAEADLTSQRVRDQVNRSFFSCQPVVGDAVAVLQ